MNYFFLFVVGSGLTVFSSILTVLILGFSSHSSLIALSLVIFGIIVAVHSLKKIEREEKK